MFIGIEASHANKLPRTGVENACWHIIQGLKNTVPSDTRVILYSNEPLRGELAALPKNWEEKVLRWPLKKLWSQLRLSLELLVHPPDVFFAPGQLIPFFCPKKTAVFIHDSAFLVYPEAYNFWGRQYLKWMNKRIIRRAAVIITSSEFNKKELIKFYHIDPEKVRVVPLAFDDKVYNVISNRSEVEAAHKQLGLNDRFIISVGRLEAKKNTVNIIRAFNILKKDDPSLHLALVGTPRVGYDKVKEELEKSPYRSDIKLLGYQKDVVVAELYNAAVALVFPSLYEGFGLPVLEAMACGCPVVTSNCCSLPEVGGEAALYADPSRPEEIANQLKIIIGDDSLRGVLVKKGLVRTSNYSWSKTAEGVAELFAKM